MEKNHSKSDMHTVINVSMDINTKQTVLTINGVITPVTDFSIRKSVFDGEESLNFSYTVEKMNENGMVERRQFFLPDPMDSVALLKLNKNGFASKMLYDDNKAKADVIDFMNKKSK